jgi:tRNA(Ile)-lysidine synthase
MKSGTDHRQWDSDDMKHTADIPEIVRRFIERQKLIPSGGKVLAAVSGGADSLCLVLVLKELGYPLGVAHFDHRLRPGSGREAEFVRRAADRLGLTAQIGEGDVRSQAVAKKMTLEEAAREMRYGFLRQAAEKASASVIATGHTRDDQAETVLLHVIRGAGLRGLSGIRPEAPVPGPATGSSVRIVRPLLELTHTQTLEYCRRSGWQPLEDPSNKNVAFARNRIRRELLPALEAYNPGIRSALARLAGIARGQEDFIEKAADDLWRNAADAAVSNLVRIRRADFQSAHIALRRELVRRSARHLRGGLEDLTCMHVGRVLAFAETPPVSARMDWTFGMKVFLEGEWIVFTADQEDRRTEEWNGRALPVPGILTIRNPDWTITLSLEEHGRKARDPWMISIPLNRIRSPLTLRKRRDGDRFHPQGMEVPVRLSDFFSAQHLPFRERRDWPLFCDREGILWVPGYRLREGYGNLDTNGTYLEIQVERHT